MRDGLRGRYWRSPKLGELATLRMVELLRDTLLKSLDKHPLGVSADRIARALELPSTKVWIDETQLQSGGQLLEVSRWIANENETGNPRMWKWTPLSTIAEIQTAWVTAEGVEWVPEGKKNRSKQVHRWGYT
jgi:hypothetical protein